LTLLEDNNNCGNNSDNNRRAYSDNDPSPERDRLGGRSRRAVVTIDLTVITSADRTRRFRWGNISTRWHNHAGFRVANTLFEESRTRGATILCLSDDRANLMLEATVTWSRADTPNSPIRNRAVHSFSVFITNVNVALEGFEERRADGSSA